MNERVERRDIQDELTIVDEYLTELNHAIDNDDHVRTGVAIATMRQALHMMTVRYPGLSDYPAAITHTNGRLDLRLAGEIDPADRDHLNRDTPIRFVQGE